MSFNLEVGAMRSKIVSLLAVTFSLGFAQAASAADMPTKGPIARAPVAAVYNWTGCYLGVAGGGNWGRSRHDNSVGPITDTFNLSGGIIGGTLGCNYQVDPVWLVGIETDFSWTNKKGSTFDIPPGNTTFLSETSEKWLGTVRGRLGGVFGAMHSELFYLTGGLAYARADITVSPPGLASASESKTRTGWTVGAGWEHKFTQNLSGKLEYLYVDLGNTAYFNPPPAGPFLDRAGGVRLTDHIVRVGLNWQFWP
jgi:outer membrane immunogenic protein